VPGGDKHGSKVDESKHPLLLAITNALWQSRHAGRGGIIYRGKILKKPANGVAAIVVFKDGKVDILEWNDEIPVSEVQDARQLKHLIAKDGKVVTSIAKRGKEVHSEIGLGSLLNEDRPVLRKPADKKNPKGRWALNLTSGPLWFLATRSAFGIRDDGNLVYALGHHINTKDLAKALVLAGCVRAIHGDANPGNAVGIIYYTDEKGKITKRIGLSPLQHRCTLERYLNRPYPKDFFAFFRRAGRNEIGSSSKTLRH
jgi:Phosphodiester glycosidase